MRNRQVLLARRPTGWVSEADFQIIDAPIPVPADGEVLVRNRYLSLDPYMRMRMSDAPSYAPHVELGEVMVGGTVGEVIESRDAALKPGDTVVGPLGWQHYGATKAARVRKVDAAGVPLSAYLGVLGMPAITAWVGFNLIGGLKEGQTVVVSAASGAVGSIAGQIAHLSGCRVIGIAGGAEKCQHVVDDLGLRACVDYKAPHLDARLRAAVGTGIDVYFENVGGEIFDMVLTMLNPFARIALCGQVSQYNEREWYAAKNLRSLLVNRVLLKGFIVSDHTALWRDAMADLTRWFKSGELRYRETVAHGLVNAPKAFIAMLKGDKLGKQIVKLDDD
jgi:NADPH-dependent curcumin reductase CurA